MADRSRSLLLARALVAGARGAWRVLPGVVKRRVEDRFQSAVHYATRVTNDGYPQPAEAIPPAGPADQGEAEANRAIRRVRASSVSA